MAIDELFQLSRRFIKEKMRPYRRSFLEGKAWKCRFSVIKGQRGVGKTTCIIQHLMDSSGGDPLTKKSLYVQADHFIVGQSSLYEIAEEFCQIGGQLICFDEIHKYPNWSLELKSISDTFPGLKIIASGSSVLEIHKGSHDLSRRALFFDLAGLSFREFCELKLDLRFAPLLLKDILRNHERHASKIVEAVESHGAKVLAMMKDYLNFGYYPYFLEYDESDLFLIALEQNIHTTVESDLLSVHPSLSGASIAKIKKLLAAIAESVPFVPDLRKLKTMLEVGDERTLKTYLKYLDDAGVISCLPRSKGGLGGFVRPEKIYLNNPNLFFALRSPGDINIGTIRESFFLSHLSAGHRISASKKGDFLIDRKYIFEVGGKKKSFSQIAGAPNSFLALDNVEIGIKKKIPLWLFGFLY